MARPPPLDTTSQFPRRKLPSISMAEFKPTSTLNPYTVIPPIGASMDEFKNHTEVLEILQKIREQEKNLPEVNFQPKPKPAKLLAHGEHPKRYVNGSFELIEDDGCNSIFSARAEKDMSEPEVTFLCESEHSDIALPDISKFRHLTTSQSPLWPEDSKPGQTEHELVVDILDPSFHTVASVRGKDPKGLEARYVSGVLGLKQAQGNMCLSDLGAFAASHLREREMPSHGYDHPAYPQPFYWRAGQADDYVEAGDEQRWQNYEPTALAQRLYWNIEEIEDYVGTGEEQQWQNRDAVKHCQQFHLSGYVGTGDEQQWQRHSPTAHNQRFNLSMGQVGVYAGPGDKQQRRKSSESLTISPEKSDEEEEDEERDGQAQEKEKKDVGKAQKKPFLRLLMDRIRRKKNPPQASASHSRKEQRNENFDIF